jgi:hypothetical protein
MTTTPSDDPVEDDATAAAEPTREDARQSDEGGRPANAEAARYRTRLRESEAARDTLTATLDGYRRRDVVQAAEAAGMARGGDLFDAGQELSAMLADDGTVDAAKVAAAAAVVLAERPHWAVRPPPRPKVDDAQGRQSPPQSSSWQKVISGRNG